MTVKDLISLLQTFDPELPVCYKIFSEQCMLEADDIKVADFCEARNDGWVENKRPDKPTRPYLVLPGN